MQTQISTTETSLLGSGLLFEEANPPGTGPIDPPDNTGGGSTKPAESEEEETTPENQ